MFLTTDMQRNSVKIVILFYTCEKCPMRLSDVAQPADMLGLAGTLAPATSTDSRDQFRRSQTVSDHVPLAQYIFLVEVHFNLHCTHSPIAFDQCTALDWTVWIAEQEASLLVTSRGLHHQVAYVHPQLEAELRMKSRGERRGEIAKKFRDLLDNLKRRCTLVVSRVLSFYDGTTNAQPRRR